MLDSSREIRHRCIIANRIRNAIYGFESLCSALSLVLEHVILRGTFKNSRSVLEVDDLHLHCFSRLANPMGVPSYPVTWHERKI